MTLRKREDIIPDLFKLAQGIVPKKEEIKHEVKKSPIDTLREIIQKRPKTKIVRKYFSDQVDIINENSDQKFYDDII